MSSHLFVFHFLCFPNLNINPVFYTKLVLMNLDILNIDTDQGNICKHKSMF